MKARNDFVSNSSSCSFIVENPRELKFDSNLVKILANANWIQFNGISFTSSAKGGNRAEKAFGKLVTEAKKLFGNKVEMGYESPEDGDDSNVEAYIDINNEDFFEKDGIKKCKLLEKIASKSSALYVNFGDDCGGGIERATQAATLLDYVYGASITADDHFCYTPVEEIGVS